MKIVQIAGGLLVFASCMAMASDDDGNGHPVDPLKVEAVREIPMDATTAYGEPMVPDADIDEGPTVAEQKEQYRRGRMAFLFGQYDIALKYWEPLAVAGYAKAQATLGWIYHTGKGAKKDLKKARYWYTRAGYQSNEIALNNLGVFYEKGMGVGKSYTKAISYYSSSANLGYKFAQYNLGMMYLRGHGTKKNQNKAIYWLQIAAYQGVDEARDQLKAMGRAVDIPEHKAVNKKSDHSPSWHKRDDDNPHRYHQKEKPVNGDDGSSSPAAPSPLGK